MRSNAIHVDQYLAELNDDQRKALESVRRVIRRHLDKDYEEGMQYGMIGYYVPHRVYLNGYHCNPKEPLPFVGLAAQKNYLSLYLMCLYADDEELKRFKREWAKSGKKLDMGKCCIRFKRSDDLALDVIGKLIKRVPAKRHIQKYETAIKSARSSNKRK